MPQTVKVNKHHACMYNEWVRSSATCPNCSSDSVWEDYLDLISWVGQTFLCVDCGCSGTGWRLTCKKTYHFADDMKAIRRAMTNAEIHGLKHERSGK